MGREWRRNKRHDQRLGQIRQIGLAVVRQGKESKRSEWRPRKITRSLSFALLPRFANSQPVSRERLQKPVQNYHKTRAFYLTSLQRTIQIHARTRTIGRKTILAIVNHTTNIRGNYAQNCERRGIMNPWRINRWWVVEFHEFAWELR